jgi:hypothetical protein
MRKQNTQFNVVGQIYENKKPNSKINRNNKPYEFRDWTSNNSRMKE